MSSNHKELPRLFWADYPYWRVRGTDRLWHRIKFYYFSYSEEPRNRNTTFCNQQINNPPGDDFVDLGWWYDTPPVPDPHPQCETCIRGYWLFKRDAAQQEADLYQRRLNGRV